MRWDEKEKTGRAERSLELDKKQDDRFCRDWKAYIDVFELAEGQKQQIWDSIQQKRQIEKPGKKKPGSMAGKGLVAAAAAACVVLVGMGSVHIVSGTKAAEAILWAGGGEILDSIRKLCGMEPESAEILQNMTPEAEVYAPPLLDCDEGRVVFTNSRGMVVYDRGRQNVTATIDLQDIGCNYFTVDSLQTKVIIEDSRIRIFNTKAGRVTGSCYVYQLPGHADAVENLKPEKVIKAEDSLQDEWEQKMNSRYYDTFANLGSETVEAWGREKGQDTKYSKDSVSWMKEGKRYFSCLLLQGGEYQLYTQNQDTGENSTEPLRISISKDAADLVKDANFLPEFVYTGDDKIMKAICDYLVEKEKGRYDEAEGSISYTFIPAPVIYDTVEENGELKVFGNFYGSHYYKNGNILEESGGGEMPACIHLKEENGSYQVVRMERTGDGSYYIKGIREFCKGYADIYEKFFDSGQTDELRKQMETAMIGQYVADNQLDIRYYHAFGWDPVELK